MSACKPSLPNWSRTGLRWPPATVRMVVQGVGDVLGHTHLGSRCDMCNLNFTMLANFFPFSRPMLMDG